MTDKFILQAFQTALMDHDAKIWVNYNFRSKLEVTILFGLKNTSQMFKYDFEIKLDEDSQIMAKLLAYPYNDQKWFVLDTGELLKTMPDYTDFVKNNG